MDRATPHNSAPIVSDALLGLLRCGDFAAAGRLLDDDATPSLEPDQLAALADGLMRRRRWAEAGWLFGRIRDGDQTTDMKRVLCGNLAAIQTHRPTLYQRLIALAASTDFAVGASPSGRPTVLARRPDGSVVSLSAGADPLAAATAAAAQLRQATPGGEPIGLCGLGDGYVLQTLA